MGDRQIQTLVGNQGSHPARAGFHVLWRRASGDGPTAGVRIITLELPAGKLPWGLRVDRLMLLQRAASKAGQ